MNNIIDVLIIIIPLIVSIFLSYYIPRIYKIRNIFNNILYSIKYPNKEFIDKSALNQQILVLCNEYNMKQDNNIIRKIKSVRSFYHYIYEREILNEKSINKYFGIKYLDDVAKLQKIKESLSADDQTIFDECLKTLKMEISIYDIISTDIKIIFNSKYFLLYLIMIPIIILLPFFANMLIQIIL